jgi:glycerate dehydrogenase
MTNQGAQTVAPPHSLFATRYSHPPIDKAAAMHKIVFLDRSTIGPRVTLRRPAFPHTLTEHQRTGPDEVLDRLAGTSIAIVNKVDLRGPLLAKLPDLKLIAVAATGTDCVDKAYCEEHGIAVANIRGYALRTVPEHTFALMLALRRSLVPYREDTLKGEWQKSGQFCFFNHPIQDLGGARLGIIGEGVLGLRVAEIAKAFGMVTMFAAHKGKSGLGPLYTPWDEVLETSDIITLHSPLTPDTRNMIAMPEFRKMKRRPLLINTARGGLVVEEDLEKALEQGLVSGAGFDVTLPEPPPADGPLMRMAKRWNVIVTPHVAWASDEAQQTLADQLIDNIDNFVAGKPSNLVKGAY